MLDYLWKREDGRQRCRRTRKRKKREEVREREGGGRKGERERERKRERERERERERRVCWVLCRGDLNFCVRCTTLRRACWRRAGHVTGSGINRTVRT